MTPPAPVVRGDTPRGGEVGRMKPILSAEFILRTGRRDYTKRQWRRLLPRLKQACVMHKINPAYITAEYDVMFSSSVTRTYL